MNVQFFPNSQKNYFSRRYLKLFWNVKVTNISSPTQYFYLSLLFWVYLKNKLIQRSLTVNDDFQAFFQYFSVLNTLYPIIYLNILIMCNFLNPSCDDVIIFYFIVCKMLTRYFVDFFPITLISHLPYEIHP